MCRINATYIFVRLVLWMALLTALKFYIDFRVSQAVLDIDSTLPQPETPHFSDHPKPVET